VGLAERLFEIGDELMAACLRLVGDCPCQDGCPSCVGPVVEVGEQGKLACRSLLAEMVTGAGACAA
jgi:DEAD/DEAH box helicase domain-containing protein